MIIFFFQPYVGAGEQVSSALQAGTSHIFPTLDLFLPLEMK